LWSRALGAGTFDGSPLDLSDGYIHLSASQQVRETARRHFLDVPSLLLVEIETDRLGPSLRWEPSRGGDLFPHLYSSLDLAAVVRVRPLPIDDDGVPVIPEDVPS
jgi:uncharacterized protein (DUF952 family)